MKFTGVLLCGLSFTVFAQDEMDDFFSMSPAELAGISVTIATGTPKTVAEAAAITSVITAEQIKIMGATNINEILATIPGFHISIQAVTNDAIYSMRGIRNSVNSEVLVMLNNTRYTVPYKGSHLTGMLLPVEAIQRIEVIRGPGSALYGADAFAGVINIITKKANDIEGTEVGVRVGNHDSQSTWGLYGGEKFGWEIAATFQYQHNNDDNDREIAGDLQTQFDNIPFLGTQASLAPGQLRTRRETWNAHLNLERKHWQLGFWTYGNINAGLRAGAAGSLDAEGDLDSAQYLFDLRYSTEDMFADWEVQLSGNYLYTDLDAEAHNFPDNTRLPIAANGNINFQTPVNLVSFPDGVINQLNIRNQVLGLETNVLNSSYTDHLFRVQAGFRYEQVETAEKRNFGPGVINGSDIIVDGTLTDTTDTDFVFLPNSHRYIWSLALQDEWQLHADWQLTLGLRYDHYSDFGNTFNPRVALVWNINDYLTSKILYGRAFRAPSFLEQKQQNSQFFNGNPDIEPETIQTIEWAIDYHPSEQFRGAINFYYYEITDPFANTIINGEITIDNGAGQDGYGTEIEWQWQAHEHWLFKGNYAWQYSRNQETNRRVTLVPEHQLYFATEWQFLPQWQLQAQLKWIGNRVNNENDNRKLKDYETVDITLSNQQRFWGFLDVAASVRNVFNSNGKEPATTQYTEHLPIPSRSYYFEASILF